MGGTKKKPLAAMEKSQDGQEEEGKTKKKATAEKTKVVGERKKVDVLVPKASDQDFMKSLGSLKAITIYGAARSLSVNAAIAKSILASLEAKGLIRKMGGFSGHYVWTVAS